MLVINLNSLPVLPINCDNRQSAEKKKWHTKQLKKSKTKTLGKHNEKIKIKFDIN